MDMTSKVKSTAAWNVVGLVIEPIVVYFAIIGIFSLPIPAIPFAAHTQNCLVAILILVNGTMYIRNCILTIRGSEQLPEEESNCVRNAAWIAWRWIVIVAYVFGLMIGMDIFAESYPLLFQYVTYAFGGILLSALLVLSARTGLVSYRAFLQGMREGQSNGNKQANKSVNPSGG